MIVFGLGLLLFIIWFLVFYFKSRNAKQKIVEKYMESDRWNMVSKLTSITLENNDLTIESE